MLYSHFNIKAQNFYILASAALSELFKFAKVVHLLKLCHMLCLYVTWVSQ